MNKSKNLDHISTENKEIARRVIDLCEIVSRTKSTECTDFYNPFEVKELTSLINTYDTISFSLIGNEDSESKAILIYPEYMDEVNPADYVSLVKIDKKDYEIAHKDVLGSLLSLGIKREKLGDIIINDEAIYFYIRNEILDYVLLNLEKIKNYGVELEVIDLATPIVREIDYEEKLITCASARLDLVLANVYNLSRSDAKNAIEAGLVKLNYKVTYKISEMLEVGDMVSMRRRGRFIVGDYLGLSKKYKLKLIIKIIK
jgi:RNA-binding protein YlmH